MASGSALDRATADFVDEDVRMLRVFVLMLVSLAAFLQRGMVDLDDFVVATAREPVLVANLNTETSPDVYKYNHCAASVIYRPA